MKLILMDIDPTKVQIRGRDTEHAGAGTHRPGPWSAWESLAENIARAESTGDPDTYTVVFLAASQLLGGVTSTVTLTLKVGFPDGKPIRTIDYQLRASA